MKNILGVFNYVHKLLSYGLSYFKISKMEKKQNSETKDFSVNTKY